MTIIQDPALIRLPFIILHDGGFDLTRPGHDVSDRTVFPAPQGGHVTLKIRKELLIRDHAVFDHLGHAGGPFGRREGVQGLRIDEHQARLMKRADQILPQRVIDTGLASHAGIHLRHQRRRNLHTGNSPREDGGRKAGHVPDDAAPQGNQHGPPFEAGVR